MGRSSWFCQPWVSSLSCLFSLLNLVSCNCMYSSELFTGFTHQESLVCFDSVLWFYSEFYALYIGNFHFCPSPTLAPHMIPSRHQTIIYNFSSHWKILKVAEGNESKSITTGTFIPFSTGILCYHHGFFMKATHSALRQRQFMGTIILCYSWFSETPIKLCIYIIYIIYAFASLGKHYG